MSDRLRLADLLGGLSIAADLGFGLPPEEAMRCCLIATTLARRRGLAEPEVSDAFYAGLMVHVGCSALSHETAAVFGDERVMTAAVARTDVSDPADVARTLMPEVARTMTPRRRRWTERWVAEHGQEFGRRFDTGSCEVASMTARRVGLGPSTQRALHEVTEWWNGEGPPQGLRGEEIAEPARIVSAAADAARFDAIGGAHAAVAALRRRAGGILDPGVVESFAADAEAILAESRAGDPRLRILEEEPLPWVEIPPAEVPRVAAAFGDLADLKTPATHGHSAGVARLATAAGRTIGLGTGALEGLGIAALLQDLGRLAVSNAIWEKPGALTRAGWEQVRMHPYHSERILIASQALAPAARDAGMHHERLDGSGYHRACRAREVTPAARVLAAADAFQAMTEHRAHRPARSPDEAATELCREVRQGRLDGDAVVAVLECAGQGRARRRDNLRPGGLSEREVEVAGLVAVGLSNPEIADRLVISRRTAEHHVQHVYAKLGVSSRAAVALFAHEHDLIGPPPLS